MTRKQINDINRFWKNRAKNNRQGGRPMYESDQCHKTCKCSTCINTNCFHARNCDNPFKCRLMHITCSTQQQVGQYRCTIIAGPDAGTPGIIVKESEHGVLVRNTLDGVHTIRREDEIIRD
jgi:hypothetical protein